MSFDFIEIAIDGAYHRNRVVTLDKFAALRASLNGTADVFTSAYRFEQGFASYTASYRPPSVKGYPGPALAVFLPIDLDNEADPSKALDDARMFIHRFEAEFEAPVNALRLFFSGHKGFSIEIPAILFGGFAPSADVATRLGRVARSLLHDLPTADLDIYDKLRLWRVPNTKHRTTGLFKIPLAVDEVLRLTLAEIRDLARAPREITLPPEDDWQPVDALVRLWRESEAEAPRPNGHARGDDFQLAHLEPIVSGCGWMRHCRDDAAELREPAWYAALGILARCEDGTRVAHE